MFDQDKVIKLAVSALGIIILVNLLVLDAWILRAKNVQTKIVTVEKTISTPSSISSSSCSDSCVSLINQATASVALSQPKTQTIVQSQPSSTANKEVFIPLGSGSNSSFDWADVSGAQVYVDSTKYGQIKSVVFEPSVHIPTGNETAYVRLFNVTDQHPVWFSDVSLSGGTPQLLFSQQITLDNGNKLYQVQMKTSLQYTAVLDQARIHIISY
jgi:hypothetical protein